jgi:outer membrane protein assembly factor BamA
MKMQGTRRLLYTSELRFSLLPIRYFNLAPSIPELSGYFNNLPFGISGALFYDTGVAWNNGILPTSDTFISGFGYGLHIHLPYIELIRIDHAFNQDGDSQFIVDIGVWF